MTEPSATVLDRLTQLIRPTFPDGETDSFYSDFDCVVNAAIYRSGDKSKPAFELHVAGGLLTRDAPEAIAQALVERDYQSVLLSSGPVELAATPDGGYVLRSVGPRPVTAW